jgi:hypothetical protein
MLRQEASAPTSCTKASKAYFTRLRPRNVFVTETLRSLKSKYFNNCYRGRGLEPLWPLLASGQANGSDASLPDLDKRALCLACFSL